MNHFCGQKIWGVTICQILVTVGFSIAVKPKHPPGGFVPEGPDDVLRWSQIPPAGSDSFLFALVGNQTLS